MPCQTEPGRAAPRPACLVIRSTPDLPLAMMSVTYATAKQHGQALSWSACQKPNI